MGAKHLGRFIYMGVAGPAHSFEGPQSEHDTMAL